jgi:hypothetical protein
MSAAEADPLNTAIADKASTNFFIFNPPMKWLRKLTP